LISTVYFVLPVSKLAMPYPVMDFIMRKDNLFSKLQMPRVNILYSHLWQKSDARNKV